MKNLKFILLTLLIIVVLYYNDFIDSFQVFYNMRFDYIVLIGLLIKSLIYILITLIVFNFALKKIINKTLIKNITHTKLITYIIFLSFIFSLLVYSYSGLIYRLSDGNYALFFQSYGSNPKNMFWFQIPYYILISPFLEELFFRKAVLDNYKGKTKKAIIFSSFLFTIAHIFNQGYLFVFIGGIILGILYIRYGFFISYLFHVFINFWSFTILIYLHTIIPKFYLNLTFLFAITFLISSILIILFFRLKCCFVSNSALP